MPISRGTSSGFCLARDKGPHPPSLLPGHRASTSARPHAIHCEGRGQMNPEVTSCREPLLISSCFLDILSKWQLRQILCTYYWLLWIFYSCPHPLSLESGMPPAMPNPTATVYEASLLYFGKCHWLPWLGLSPWFFITNHPTCSTFSFYRVFH